jgi:hypothetical protein
MKLIMKLSVSYPHRTIGKMEAYECIQVPSTNAKTQKGADSKHGAGSLIYSSTLKMKTTCSPESSVDLNGTQGVVSRETEQTFFGTPR